MPLRRPCTFRAWLLSRWQFDENGAILLIHDVKFQSTGLRIIQHGSPIRWSLESLRELDETEEPAVGVLFRIVPSGRLVRDG